MQKVTTASQGDQDHGKKRGWGGPTHRMGDPLPPLKKCEIRKLEGGIRRVKSVKSEETESWGVGTKTEHRNGFGRTKQNRRKGKNEGMGDKRRETEGRYGKIGRGGKILRGKG